MHIRQRELGADHGLDRGDAERRQQRLLREENRGLQLQLRDEAEEEIGRDDA